MNDPLRRLALIWFALAGLVLLFMLCRPRPVPVVPEPLPTLPMVVLPTLPATATLTPAPTVTPRESVLLPTRTPVPPTLTFTPLPTATPTHTPGTRVTPRAVQRG